MKRIIKMIMVLLTIVSLGACGSKEVQDPSGETINSTTGEITNNKADDQKEESPEVALNYLTIKVPTKSIYVDYESKLRSFSESCGDLLLESNDALVGVCYDVLYDELPKLEDVPMYFAKDFLFNAEAYSRGKKFDSEYQVVTEEMVTVAGFDAVKFTGTVRNCDKWDCHVYGYAFVIDEVPFAVIGLVSEETQSPELIEKIEARVDYMVSTLRITE